MPLERKTLPVYVTATANQETRRWLITLLDSTMEKGLGTAIGPSVPCIGVTAISDLQENTVTLLLHNLHENKTKANYVMLTMHDK